MIIIKNASKDTVLANIETEKTFLQGLADTADSIDMSPAEVASDIADYISHNAVLNGIEKQARAGISSKHTLVQTISFALKNTLSVLSYIETAFKKSNTKVYDTEILTYKQKGMFDFISAANFFGSYTSKVLDIVLTQPKTLQGMLNKADLEFVNKTVNYYNVLLKRLCGSERDLKRSIDILSDDVYSEEDASILTQVKGREVVTNNLMPHELNPKYWIKYRQMKNDVERIKVNRGKIDTYAMKLQKLENKKRHTEDPTLDRQIEYWVNQIQILDANIAETEAKYA